MIIHISLVLCKQAVLVTNEIICYHSPFLIWRMCDRQRTTDFNGVVGVDFLMGVVLFIQLLRKSDSACLYDLIYYLDLCIFPIISGPLYCSCYHGQSAIMCIDFIHGTESGVACHLQSCIYFSVIIYPSGAHTAACSGL